MKKGDCSLRQSQEAKNATINRELALKRMYHLGLKATPAKVLRVPAFPYLSENNVRKRFLEDGHYHKIVAHCSELWFRSIVGCGRTYGRRISELLNMQVGQINLAQRVIRLEPGTTKNREGREVVMTEAVYTLLSACVVGKRAGDYVFTLRAENGCVISAEPESRPASKPASQDCCFTICAEPQRET